MKTFHQKGLIRWGVSVAWQSDRQTSLLRLLGGLGGLDRPNIEQEAVSGFPLDMTSVWLPAGKTTQTITSA